MTLQETIKQAQKHWDGELRPGPSWPSLESLRTEGAKKLFSVLGIGQVGRLQTQKAEYVIMRTETFNALYGEARDVRRLQGALMLVRQAVQLVLHLGEPQQSGKIAVEKIAVEHLRDLVVQFPELKTNGAEPRAYSPADLREDSTSEDVTQDTMDDFELDPARVTRPSLTDTVPEEPDLADNRLTDTARRPDLARVR